MTSVRGGKSENQSDPTRRDIFLRYQKDLSPPDHDSESWQEICLADGNIKPSGIP